MMRSKSSPSFVPFEGTSDWENIPPPSRPLNYSGSTSTSSKNNGTKSHPTSPASEREATAAKPATAVQSSVNLFSVVQTTTSAVASALSVSPLVQSKCGVMTDEERLNQEISFLRDCIIQALRDKAKKIPNGYNALVSQFSATKESLMFYRWYKALNKCVSAIASNDNGCDELISATILHFDFGAQPQPIVDAFYHYLFNMVSSNVTYTKPCFRAFVKHYLPRKDSSTEKSAGGIDLESTRIASERVHVAVRRIMEIVPSSPTLLLPFLSEKFPHTLHPLESHRVFLYNVLHIFEYCPVLRPSITSLIVERFILIDVEIKLEEVIEDDEDLLQFDLQIDNTTPPKRENQKQISEMADKLDVMMGIMFEFINMYFKRNPSDLDDLFHWLLRVFDTYIISTHKSKYAQFLVYYICSLKPQQYIETFLGYLLNKILSPNEHKLTRQTACAYIASLIARAPFASVQIIQKCLSVLVHWVHEYLAVNEDKAPNLEQHALFYSICQATYYIFSFRHKELLETEQGRTFFQKLGFDRMNSSKLNPFKLCQSSVVREFSKVSRSHQLSFEHIIEKNRNLVLPTKASLGANNGAAEFIESFFPFDPYLLRESSKYINDIYLSWKSVAVEEDEEDDEVAGSVESGSSYVAGSMSSSYMGGSFESNQDTSSYVQKILQQKAKNVRKKVSFDVAASPIGIFEDDNMMCLTPDTSVDFNYRQSPLF